MILERSEKSKTGYKGVWQNGSNSFAARYAGKFIGNFRTASEAAIAYHRQKKKAREVALRNSVCVFTKRVETHFSGQRCTEGRFINGKGEPALIGKRYHSFDQTVFPGIILSAASWRPASNAGNEVFSHPFCQTILCRGSHIFRKTLFGQF